VTEIGINVQQQGYSVSADGGPTRTLQGTRSGALFTAELYDQWLRAGKVFSVGGGDAPVITSTVENNTAIDLTEPFLLHDVPSSKVVVPIMVKVSPAVVWETGDEIVLYASDAVGFSAGGDTLAATIRNLAVPGSGDSELAATATTAIYDGDAALTMAAVSEVRVIDAVHRLTGDLFSPYEYNILKGDPMVMLHGPSSLALMIARTTTTVEVLYTYIWAELDKNELVNS